MCRRKGNFDAVRVVELHIRYISVYGIAHIVHEMRNEMIACEFVFHRERMHTIIKCWTTPFSRSISLLIWMQEQGTISSCLLLCSSIFSLPLLLFPLSFHNYLSISNCSVAVQFRVAQSKETKWKEKKKNARTCWLLNAFHSNRFSVFVHFYPLQGRFLRHELLLFCHERTMASTVVEIPVTQ